MKRLICILSCLFFVLTAIAVPAKHIRKTLRLTDGTTIEATLYGNSSYSWYLTDDGFVLEWVSGEPDIYKKTTRTMADEMAYEGVSTKQKAPRRIGSQATAPLPATGSPKVPVVLVNFTDSVFHVADTDEGIRAYYDLYCNGTRDGQRYKDHGSFGAIRDYFSDQSDGVFTPEFVIIGPVTLDHPESYYGSNSDDGKSKDLKYDTFCADVIKKATASYTGSWSDFDNRGKGKVDLIFFIYAGCGEANGGPSTTLWPKEKTSSKTYGGVTFSTSACCNENTAMKYDDDGNPVIVQPDGIGIMCHELSHALGLPDFYDTSYKAFGMDLWSLMDYGCYGDEGYIPGAYNAYERDFMGWRPLVTLTENQELTIKPISDGGFGYKIVNDANSNEYYIIECRDSVEWDYGLFKRTSLNLQVAKPGLQITHVDYNASSWSSNNVNTNASHQRMTIFAANNRYIGTSISSKASEWKKTWMGNLYPYNYTDENGVSQCNDALTATTTPAAVVYTASGFMNKDINGIRRSEDGSVSLYFGNDYGTGIQTLSSRRDEAIAADELFDLSGRRLSPQGAKRAGIYLTRKGRKILVR